MLYLMNEKKTWWQRQGWIAIGGAVILLLIISYALQTQQKAAIASVTGSGSPSSTWYYVNKDYQCVQAGQFQAEDQCQQAVGTQCSEGDPMCGGNAVKLNMYYIDSSNHCILAPNNPYSPIGGDGGKFSQDEACQKDVGQTCYENDVTCGGVGATGTVTIKGVVFTLATASQLKQSPLDLVGKLVAVNGTMVAAYPEKSGTVYDLVIQTKDNGLIVDTQGTVDPNTSASNGFQPADFPTGTKVLAGGAFMNTITVSALGQNDARLAAMNLPADTPLIFSEGADYIEAASQ